MGNDLPIYPIVDNGPDPTAPVTVPPRTQPVWTDRNDLNQKTDAYETAPASKAPTAAPTAKEPGFWTTQDTWKSDSSTDYDNMSADESTTEGYSWGNNFGWQKDQQANVARWERQAAKPAVIHRRRKPTRN